MSVGACVFLTLGPRVSDGLVMLATLATRARVKALWRTGFICGPGGGRELWTGRLKSGTLQDSVRAAKAIPNPASYLRRRPE